MKKGSPESREENAPFLTQIVFPINDTKDLKSHAFLIGWNIDNFRCCIITAFEEPSERYLDVQDAISRTFDPLSSIHSTCSPNGVALPIILGEWIPLNDILKDDYIPDSHFQGQGIWITMTSDNENNLNIPKLYSVYSLGCLYSTSCYIVQYESVDTDKLRSVSISNNYTSKINENKEMYNNYNENTDLEYIVAQINAGHDLSTMTQYYLNNDNEEKSNYSIISIFQYCILKLFELPITVIAWVFYVIIYYIKVIIDYRFTNVSNMSLGYLFSYVGINERNKKEQRKSDNSISDNSIFFYIISEKINKLKNILSLCGKFVTSWNRPAVERQKIWTDINSIILMLLIDIILGIVIGRLIYKNSSGITYYCTEISVFLQRDILKNTIESFKHSPLGIKLNPLITKKIGYVLKLLLNEFASFIYFTTPIHIIIVQIIAFFGSFGLTTQMSLMIDLVNILTIHIFLIYKISSILYKFQTNLIFSLFSLFKGQKINILRKRLDTCSYDRMQLLFGMVLFSMVFFLFPSFAAYFYLFSITQGSIICIQIVLWSFIIFIKEFPYYSLFIYIFDPLLITKGLKFQLVNDLINENKKKNIKNENRKIDIFSFMNITRFFTSRFMNNKSVPPPIIPMKTAIITPNYERIDDNSVSNNDKFNVSDDKENHNNNIKEQIDNDSNLLNDDKKRSRGHTVDTSIPYNAPKYGDDGSIINEYSSLVDHNDGSGIVNPLLNTNGQHNINQSYSNTPKHSPQKSIFQNKKENTDNLRLFHNSNSMSMPLSPGGIKINTIYLLLSPRLITTSKLFDKYMDYFSYFTAKNGFFISFFTGIIYGSPSLDFQKIKLTLKINKDYEKFNDLNINDNEEVPNRSKSFADILKIVSNNKLNSEEYPSEGLKNVPEINSIFSPSKTNQSELYETDKDKKLKVEDINSPFDIEKIYNNTYKKNKIKFQSKTHQKLNKFLLFYVLITYVIIFLSSICGVGFFIYDIIPKMCNFSKMKYDTKISYFFMHNFRGGGNNATENILNFHNLRKL